MKNELDEYINFNLSDDVSIDKDNFYKNSLLPHHEIKSYIREEASENLESVNQIINEKNCLIEELKSYILTLRSQFESECANYSVEVN